MADIVKMPRVCVEHPDGSRSYRFEGPTTTERLHDSVLRHNIMWADLTARVVKNEGIPEQEAAAQVSALIEQRTTSLEVAAALIDLINERIRG